MKQGMEDRREEEEEDVYSFLLSAPALKPLGICTLLMVFQQFSGINAVMFYSVSIFVASGSPSPHASTIILGIVNIAATIISNLLIDRLGRKVGKSQSRPQRSNVWSAGAVAALLCRDDCQPRAAWLPLPLRLNLPRHPSCRSHGKSLLDATRVPKPSSQVYIVSFSLGFGPIPWLLMGELLPSRARGPCAAFATGSPRQDFCLSNPFT